MEDLVQRDRKHTDVDHNIYDSVYPDHRVYVETLGWLSLIPSCPVIGKLYFEAPSQRTPHALLERVLLAGRHGNEPGMKKDMSILQ